MDRACLENGGDIWPWYTVYKEPQGRCHGNHFVPMCPHSKAHWRHLANTTESSICCGDAALCQIALTTCSVSCPHSTALSVGLRWLDGCEAHFYAPAAAAALDRPICDSGNLAVNSLDFVAKRFLMKLFNTNNMQIIEFCCEQFNSVLPSRQIANRRDKFIKSDSPRTNLLAFVNM